MAQNTKAVVTANVLTQRLKLRLPSTYTITQSFDGSNNPCVLVQQRIGQLKDNNALVQIVPSLSTYNNLVGSSEDFGVTPTILNVYQESVTTVSGSSFFNTPVGSADFEASLFVELVNSYGIMQNYAVNSGITLSVAALANTLTTASTLVQTTVPELQTASGMAAG